MPSSRPDPALPPATLEALLWRLRRQFSAADLPTPGLDARLITGHVLGLSQEDMVRAPDLPLPATERDRVLELAARRLAGTPVARLIGRRDFWGLRFDLSPGTLEPRPDSETLIDAALEEWRRRGGLTHPRRVLDLGTGTGCLLLAFLHEFSGSRGLGLDIAADAVTTARANARRLRLAHRAHFRCADWNRLEPRRHRFDLILSNPPYIPTQQIGQLQPEVWMHDPLDALDGGPDGLSAYRALAPRLAAWLAPGGLAVLELGHGQEPHVLTLVGAAGLGHVTTLADLGGVPRALVLTAPAGR